MMRFGTICFGTLQNKESGKLIRRMTSLESTYKALINLVLTRLLIVMNLYTQKMLLVLGCHMNSWLCNYLQLVGTIECRSIRQIPVVLASLLIVLVDRDHSGVTPWSRTREEETN